MTLSFRWWSCIPALVLATSASAAQSSFFDCDPAAPNNALEFDGMGDCVSVPYNPSFPTTVFTLAAWISLAPADTAAIVARGEDPASDDAPWSLLISGGSGTLGLMIETTSGSQNLYDAGTVVADQTWHHVGCSRSSSGALAFFVDGAQVSTFSSSLMPSPDNQQQLTIGCSFTSDGPPPVFPGLFAKGMIDDVSLWSTVLTPSQVHDLYLDGPDLGLPGLVGSWSFDEGIGQSVLDGSSLGNDGTLGFEATKESADPQRALAISCPLSAVGTDLSVSEGGTQQFRLDPGSEFALMLYFVAGTTSGTSPGFALGSLAIPLNPDAFFFYTVNHPNMDPYKKTLGFLTAAGEGSARITIPPGSAPSLVGLQLNHAYLVWDVLGGGGAVFTSNPVPLSFVP